MNTKRCLAVASQSLFFCVGILIKKWYKFIMSLRILVVHQLWYLNVLWWWTHRFFIVQQRRYMLGRKWIDDYYFHDDDVAIIVFQISCIWWQRRVQSFSWKCHINQLGSIFWLMRLLLSSYILRKYNRFTHTTLSSRTTTVPPWSINVIHGTICNDSWKIHQFWLNVMNRGLLGTKKQIYICCDN